SFVSKLARFARTALSESNYLLTLVSGFLSADSAIRLRIQKIPKLLIQRYPDEPLEHAPNPSGILRQTAMPPVLFGAYELLCSVDKPVVDAPTKTSVESRKLAWRKLLQQGRVGTDMLRRVLACHQSASIVAEHGMDAPVRAGQRSTVVADDGDLAAPAADHFLTLGRTDRQVGCPWWSVLSEQFAAGECATNRMPDKRKQGFTPYRKFFFSIRREGELFAGGVGLQPTRLEQADNMLLELL